MYAGCMLVCVVLTLPAAALGGGVVLQGQLLHRDRLPAGAQKLALEPWRTAGLESQTNCASFVQSLAMHGHMRLTT